MKMVSITKYFKESGINVIDISEREFTEMAKQFFIKMHQRDDDDLHIFRSKSGFFQNKKRINKCDCRKGVCICLKSSN